MKRVSGMQSVDSTEAISDMHMPKHFRDLGSDESRAALNGSWEPWHIDKISSHIQLACCDPFNEKALREACGASLQLPIVSGTCHDLCALMTKYDMKIMASHPESSSDGTKVTHPLSKELADSLVNESLCLVLGSEGNGFSTEIHQTYELVNISMEGLLVQSGVLLKAWKM